MHASSGMRRIMALAYFLVWAWDEHQKAAKQLQTEPTNQVTFLIDEIESHLHPIWQRSIVPAVLSVMNKLASSANVQLVAATHSPLIMASVETIFDHEKDAWYDLDYSPDQHDVILTKRLYLRHGDVSNWLTSEAFDLGSARSLDAEKVLKEAMLVLRSEEVTSEAAKELDTKLRSVLGDTDPFWIRWQYVG